MRMRMLAVPVALVALVAAARPTIISAVSRNPTPNVVTIRAGEYFFQAPEAIPAGMTTFRLVTTGKEMHHVAMFRLTGGHTLADLLDSFKTEGPPPSWVTAMGGPNAPAPGASFGSTIDMTPGTYAIVCFIPGPDGKPHVMKGMAHSFTVKGKESGKAPKADVTLRLSDFDFTSDIALTAGRHTIRVENTAAQDHEVEFVKLAPGKSAKDVVEWVGKMDGPPPGTPIGGVTPLASNGVNYIELDLEPGRYALICFAGDAKEGKPHFMLGMMKEIEVK